MSQLTTSRFLSRFYSVRGSVSFLAVPFKVALKISWGSPHGGFDADAQLHCNDVFQILKHAVLTSATLHWCPGLKPPNKHQNRKVGRSRS